MKRSVRPTCASSREPLLDLLATEFDEAQQAFALFDDLLQHERYNHGFCLRLFAVARQRTGASWSIRRLAVLMLEHQILKLHPGDLDDFDFVLTQLNLKEASGQGVVRSVLEEGYSTTDLRRFIPEFRRRLARLNRIHRKVKGRRTPLAALGDFIALSHYECKLTLARYLFTPEDIVTEILGHLQVTRGVKDPGASQPAFVDAEAARGRALLPEYEATILRKLCEGSRIYWVSATTSSAINSLVEYPATTVVLVVKPPGSDIEFEIKRAGRKEQTPLNVVFARNGHTVPPSHRLDGGSMQWLLRYEAKSASQLSAVYRLVHGVEAPMAHYVSRTTISTVPVRGGEVQTLTYFTEPQAFGKGFREMRVAMKESVAAFRAEGHPNRLDLPGDLGLTAQFIGMTSPTQAVLSGTSSFRLDKLATYLSSNGPQLYFEDGLATASAPHDEQRFADALLEEVLGVYRPPDVRYRSYTQYLTTAFSVPANRARADRVYLSLVRQIATFWGTLLAVRGYSRGESFVARNVGLKSVWRAGRWHVSIIFMDHDALDLPGPTDQGFDARTAIPGMALDESYIWEAWPPEQFATSEVGYLQAIYRVSKEVDKKRRTLARMALTKAYKKTQHELLTNHQLRPFFHEDFVNRLLDWDTMVKGYLRITPETDGCTQWTKEMKQTLAEKGYEDRMFDVYREVIENHRGLLERQAFLFGVAGNGRL